MFRLHATRSHCQVTSSMHNDRLRRCNLKRGVMVKRAMNIYPLT